MNSAVKSISHKFDRLYLNTKELRLSALFRSGKSDKLIVFVPGITSPAATWQFVFKNFPIKYNILILDNRGRGCSEHATSYTLKDYAEDLKAWIDFARSEEIILVGHSMGARIVAYLNQYLISNSCPSVLIEPPLSGYDGEKYPIDLDFFLKSYASAKLSLKSKQPIQMEAGWDQERTNERLKWLPTCDVQAIIQSHEGFNTDNFYPLWTSMEDSLTKLIYGNDSPVIHADGLNRLKNLKPQIECIAVENAGHMIPWDNFDGFDHALQMTLKRLELNDEK